MSCRGVTTEDLEDSWFTFVPLAFTSSTLHTTSHAEPSHLYALSVVNNTLYVAPSQ